MISVLWFLLGGAVVRVLGLYFGAKERRALQLCVLENQPREQKRSTVVVIFYKLCFLLDLLLWPLSLILVALERPIFSALAKTYPSRAVKCAVCGYENLVYTHARLAGRWLTPPYNWYVNRDLEFACSAKCAHHLDHCPNHRQQGDAQVH